MIARSLLPRCRRRGALVLVLLASGAWLVGSVAPCGASALGLSINDRVRSARAVAPALGVHVVSLDDGATVYEYQADQTRIPASNTKLFTTATALARLGPGWQFETRLLVRGEVVAGALRGEAAVVGGGDPNISGRSNLGDSLAVFRGWGVRLVAAGVRRVDGDLLLVDGRFAGEAVHPEWPADQLHEWYEASVSALSFNDNCVLVRVEPGLSAGAPAVVELVPDVAVAGLTVEVATSARRGERQIGVHRSPDGRVVVSGRIGLGATRWEEWVAVPDPVAWFAAALREGLAQAGVTVSGASRRVDTLPAPALPGGDWREVAVHRSDLLSTIEIVNKRSQNFYAETVFKTLGAELCGEGSWQAGRRAVGEFLAEAGIAPPGAFQLSDGSGMSRANRFTPRQVTTLLGFMFRHRWGAEFMRSLPYSGEEDLRWERRLATGATRGNVFAKTGWLRAASALSGYAKGRSGRLYAFSILLNGVSEKWRADEAEDAIVRALVEGG